MDKSNAEKSNTDTKYEEYIEKIYSLLKTMNIDKLRYYYAYMIEYEKE